MSEEFDLSDGKNKYKPCPRCRSDCGMGYISRRGFAAIECILCGFRGPEIAFEVPSWKVDKMVFDAWNNVPRGES